MRVTIEKVLGFASTRDKDYQLAFTESGVSLVRPKAFELHELVLFFQKENSDSKIEPIEEFEILNERFMQEGDDVTHLFL